MKLKLLTMMILISIIVILGCVSNTTNTAQNNTTVNTTGSFINTSANISIDTSNYYDNSGLTSSEKVEAIKIALNVGRLQQYFEQSTNISVGEVLPADDSVKPVWLDSGFINTSDKIVSVSINTSGNVPMYWPVYFAVYVDIHGGKAIGVDEYFVRFPPGDAETTIPPHSYYYHQLAGSTRTSQEYNTTRIGLSVVTGDNNTDSIFPLILDSENFEKFRNGSSYEALQYTDFETNKTCLIDGTVPLHPQNAYNGSAVWMANISISYRSPAEDSWARPVNYYIVLQNNADREFPVRLNIYTGMFFP